MPPRRFTLIYHLEDDTAQVHEQLATNSGVESACFIQRGRLARDLATLRHEQPNHHAGLWLDRSAAAPEGEMRYLTLSQLLGDRMQLGHEVRLHGRRMRVVGCDAASRELLRRDLDTELPPTLDLPPDHLGLAAGPGAPPPPRPYATANIYAAPAAAPGFVSARDRTELATSLLEARPRGGPHGDLPQGHEPWRRLEAAQPPPPPATETWHGHRAVAGSCPVDPPPPPRHGHWRGHRDVWGEHLDTAATAGSAAAPGVSARRQAAGAAGAQARQVGVGRGEAGTAVGSAAAPSRLLRFRACLAEDVARRLDPNSNPNPNPYPSPNPNPNP